MNDGIFAEIGQEGDGQMTQDEKWQTQYDEMVAFINKNHRNPSKYVDEERGLVNWCKHQRKIINAGEMKPEFHIIALPYDSLKASMFHAELRRNSRSSPSL